MYDEFYNELWPTGYNQNPGRQTFVGFGSDEHPYIATAALLPSAYTTSSLIQAKLGGLTRLIEAVDDSFPPAGTLNPNSPPNNPALATLNAVIQNITTEINGYLSSIYPIPLMQTGTVAILQVTAVSTDGNSSITALSVVEPGNYLVAPGTNQNPVYMKFIDPLANDRLWQNINVTQNAGTPYLRDSGTGAILTVTYQPNSFTDESLQTLTAYGISTVTPPTIVNGGINYNVNDLLVLVGGSSVVPAKVREAALELICYDLYNRRLAPTEKNMFAMFNEKWRGTKDKDGLLTKIGEGEMQLDGTFKRFFSVGAVWSQKSVLFGANSL